MIQPRGAENAMQAPLKIVGSCQFGRYPKISSENTINMFTANDFSVNFPGYQYRLSLNNNGRGLYSSVKKANQMFSVSDNKAYRIQPDLTKAEIFTLTSNTGDVFIDEDILGNIGFCDGQNVYVYNYVNNFSYIAGTNPYSVGTITQSGATITGSGTTFTAAMVGSTIYFDDKTSAKITAYASATSITVDVSATRASPTSYVIMAPLDFVPNYICFHNGRFIVTSASSGGKQVGQWRLSYPIVVGNLTFIAFPGSINGVPFTAQFQGGFQTKPDLPIAVVRFPGRENNILIIGSICAELWTDAGNALFPYVKNTSFNIDYGTVNAATVATLDNMVAWIGQNERAGIVLMYTTGQDIKKISTDGINDLFESLQTPQQSYGLSFQQTGHLFYIATFYGQGDNISFAFDFADGGFYQLTDENLNYYIAKHTVYFNNTYYFIDINDGDIFELNKRFTTYQYSNKEYVIPRSRVTDTWRSPDGMTRRGNALSFVLEQGVDATYTGEGNYIDAINVTAGGTDYTECQVVIEGDGQNAYAEAVIVDGEVTAIDIVNAGIGYTWAVVTLVGDGTGAFAEPKLKVAHRVPRVDLSVSYDGGYTWTPYVEMKMQRVSHFKNRFYHNDLGSGNEFTFQFNYRCEGRFVCTNGQVSFY